MATNYIANPSGTASLTGWTKSGGTLQQTADGVRWYGTGSHQLLIAAKTASPDNTKMVLSGLQIRRNTSATAQPSLLRLTGDFGYVTTYPRIAFTDFPVGTFVTVPNSNYTQTVVPSGEDPDAYGLRIDFQTSGGAYDYTFRNAGIYEQSDAPVGAVIDEDDAAFSYTQADDSLSVTFTKNASDEAVDQLLWDFGDGTTTSGDATVARSQTHAFPRAGVYNVTLTAKNTVGATSDVAGVGDAARTQTTSSVSSVVVPAGDFTAKYTYQVDYPVVSVNGQTSTAPTRSPVQVYAWNWGDGSTSSGANSVHEYTQPGTYTVTLTTSNADVQRSSVVSKAIVVQGAAPQIGAPVYQARLFFDDPLAQTSPGSTLQAEMTPILKAMNVQHNWTRNEMPSLRFKAPYTWLADTLGSGTTKENLRSDIVLRFNFGAGWVEPPNARFTIDTITEDPLNPQTVVDVACMGVASDLDGVFFTPEIIGSAYSKDEIKANYSRLFSASTPGAIGRKLLPVATTPGSGGPVLNFLSLDFSPTADSKVSPWTVTLSNLTVTADANGTSLLKTLVDNGAIDWYTQNNVLRWFNPGTSGKRATTDVVPELVAGRDINAAPQTRDMSAQTWGAIVVSGSIKPWVVTDADSTSESYQKAYYRGRRYIAIQAEGTDSSDVALAVAKPTLRQRRRARDGEMTRDLMFYPDMPWCPYRDYWVGDAITAPGPDGVMITTTVESITVAITETEGLTASLILGRAFALDPLASKVASLQGGGGVSVGAVGDRAPSAVTGFIGQLVSNEITNDNGSFDAGATGITIKGVMPAGTATLFVGADTTSALVQSPAIYARTYSSAANVYVTSFGTIGRSTSASKYKLNIEAQDFGDAVLGLDIKTWYDKNSCEDFVGMEDADVGRQVGLIAEDLIDVGLDDFVQYDHQTGEVEGIQYDRVALLLIPLVKQLRDDLEERDAVLEKLLSDVAELKAATT